MRLHADDAVHDVHACLLHAARPLDVGLFVEARLQLDDDGDLLALLRRFDQRVHHRALVAGSIDRLLDREHLGVARGKHDEVLDGRERLVRMVEQDVRVA